MHTHQARWRRRSRSAAAATSRYRSHRQDRSRCRPGCGPGTDCWPPPRALSPLAGRGKRRRPRRSSSTARATTRCMPGTATWQCLAGSSGLCKDHGPTAAAAASPNPAEATGPTGATVLLDGTASSDPDGDSLVYSWREETTTLGTGSTLSVFLPIATHVITLDVDDAHH